MYVLQEDKAEAQPFPVVTHPTKKFAQEAVEDKVTAASVQAKGLHPVELAVLVVHGPSDPIILEQPLV